MCPDKLPVGWKSDVLGKYAYIKGRIGWRGLKAEEYTDSGPYLIAGNHILGNRVAWDKCQHISKYRYMESPEISLRDGDVILSKDGTIGRLAYIDRLPGEATINSTMMLVRTTRREILDGHFLYYYLQGDRFQKLIVEKVSGSSIPHIFQADMKNLVVEFPPIREQRQIAAILSTIDTAIEQTESTIAKQRRIRHGLVQDLLTRGVDENGELRPTNEDSPGLYVNTILGWIPKEWVVTTLGEIVKKHGGIIQTGPFGSQLHASEYVDDGVPVVMPQDITEDGKISLDNIARILPRKAKELSRHAMRENDVVFARRGDLSRCSTISPREGGWLCGTGCLLVRPPAKVINGKWLSSFYQYDTGQRHIRINAVGSTMVNLNTSILGALTLAKPSIQEQQIMVDVLEKMDRKIDTEVNELWKLRKIKSGLMNDLLTGQVRVNALID